MNFEGQGQSDNGDMSYEYRPSDAYWKQEMEQKKALLIEEFQQADLNKDNQLSEKELLQFLDLKVSALIIIIIIFTIRRNKSSSSEKENNLMN